MKALNDCKILIIGANSLVAQSFIRKYGEVFQVVALERGAIKSIYESDEQYDMVIFLAQSNEYKSAVYTEGLFNVNVKLLFDCLHFLKNRTQRFVHFSTGSVYQSNHSEIINESTKLNLESTNPYVMSKLSAEMVVRGFSSLYSSLYILRPFFIYGKKQKDNMLFKVMAKNIMEHKAIKLSGERGLIFNPIYTEDVADLLRFILQSTKTGLQIFNVAGPEIISLREVISKMGSLIGIPPLIEITGKVDNRLVSNVNIPGWAPITSIDVGLKSFFDSE